MRRAQGLLQQSRVITRRVLACSRVPCLRTLAQSRTVVHSFATALTKHPDSVAITRLTGLFFLRLSSGCSPDRREVPLSRNIFRLTAVVFYGWRYAGCRCLRRCFFSRVLCFVVGKERYCISDNSKIVFLKFVVFLELLSSDSSQPASLFFQQGALFCCRRRVTCIPSTAPNSILCIPNIFPGFQALSPLIVYFSATLLVK